MSESFAWTHRNNLALGLDLRSDEGKQIFSRLVADADAVFANFKPGTLAALGFPYDTLRKLNPRIVACREQRVRRQRTVEQSDGVRAAGACHRRRQQALDGEARPTADGSRHRFYDATTVFPDHVVGRITAIGALAALIHRDRTGAGARVHVSQAEAVVNQLDAALRHRRRCAPTGHAEVRDDTSVHDVLPVRRRRRMVRDLDPH